MQAIAAAGKAVSLVALDGIALWLCPLHDWPSQGLLACLDSAELARAHRLRSDLHRRRYLAAHTWLRLSLGAWLAVPPASLKFIVDPLGKPLLKGHENSHFNLSHSDDWALIGASRNAEIGVDIEVLRELDDASALAQRHFTESERAACVSSGEADQAFLRTWTRKEACLKAVGSGLRIAPSSFDTGTGLTTAWARLVTPQGIRTVEVSSVATGIDAAAAVARLAT